MEKFSQKAVFSDACETFLLCRLSRIALHLRHEQGSSSCWVTQQGLNYTYEANPAKTQPRRG